MELSEDEHEVRTVKRAQGGGIVIDGTEGGGIVIEGTEEGGIVIDGTEEGLSLIHISEPTRLA